MEHGLKFKNIDKKSNKGCFFIIFILLAYIALEPFISIKIGNKIIVSKDSYDEMKSISDKYSRQEAIINMVKNKFLFKPDDNLIKEASIKGAIAGFNDPYTSYMDKDEFSSLMNNLDGSITGIGVIVSEDFESGFLNIDSVLPDSPALAVGLKVGDKILKIDNVDVNINFNDFESVIKKMRGKENTKVNVSIMRDGQTLNFDIVRKKTPIPCVFYKKINDVGYIKLLAFDRDSSYEFKNAFDKLKNNGANKLIIDLRDNLGGLLEEAIDISNLFLPPNTLIAYTKDNRQKKTEIKSSKFASPTQLPTVIIVNKNSASASELFSGMMKDYKLAKIIGCSTFGKGLVQTVETFKDGSAVKITVSEYFTPLNHKINKIGVSPDIDLSDHMKNENPVNLSYDLKLISKDYCVNKALELLKKQIKN